MYYHIRIDYYDSNLKVNQTQFLYDQEDYDLIIRHYIAPYIREQVFYFSGAKVNSKSVSQLQIYMSESRIDDCVSEAYHRLPRNTISFYTREDILTHNDLVKNITDEVVRVVLSNIEDNSGRKDNVDQPTAKKPMVFISHKYDDIEFVRDLCDLLQDIGLDKTNLFCSSIPGLWIGLSKDIFESLRNLFLEYDLYVIFVQTPNYYLSPVSLNEMGAAWVLHSKFCSILSKDMQYSDMKGVFDKSKAAIKVDEDVAKDRLNELKNDILKFLEKEPIADNEDSWIRHRDSFLRAVNK